MILLKKEKPIETDKFTYIKHPLNGTWTKINKKRGMIIGNIKHKPKISSRITEAQLQSQSIAWFRLQYPQYAKLIWANPNGGSRHILEAVNLKRQGVLSGVPDVTLAVPRGTYHGAYIEFKRKGGKLSESQKEMMERLGQQGYYCVMIDEFEEFVKFVGLYLSLKDNTDTLGNKV